MNYQECLDFLFNQFPQYQTIGGKAFKPGLDTIKSVCHYLGNPQDELNIVHVAGTNGKGSTCSMTASILQETGYKVGLFTSPHLIDFTERIKVNGNPIPKESVVQFVENHIDFFNSINASFFEWTTALAFQYFKDQNVDWVLLETGLGGRLDSTNICNPKLSVITSIGIDHTQYLGNTIEEIAVEKGGIIKSNVPVVVSSKNEEVVINLLSQTAIDQNSEIFISDIESDFESDLKGKFQKYNRGTSVSILKYLEKYQDLNFKPEDIINGFKNVIKNAGLRGRFETLQENPLIIADIGHNYDGVKANMNALNEISLGRKVHFVWGMVNDKEIDKIVKLLPIDAKYYLSTPSIPRAMPVDDLLSHFEQHTYARFSSMLEAFNKAKSNAKKEDIIFVGGSNFVVSEIILEFFNQ